MAWSTAAGGFLIAILASTLPAAAEILANQFDNSITVYPLSASGDQAPLRHVAGNATGLKWAVQPVVDPVNNEILVACWFFQAENVEAVVKVLNGCGINGRYWVFAGGLTDVKVRLTVRDKVHNATRTYDNPQKTPFQPIQDTSAFATCP